MADAVTRDAGRLVLYGGRPAITEPLPRFNTVGGFEAQAAADAVLKGPLSGYLGGERRGGYYVERLEAAWAKMFDVKHAVSCNSGTSGILLACMAAGVKLGTEVRTTPYTMSGSVAPAALLGARIIFGDIDEDTYCLRPTSQGQQYITISTNLFGHPGNLQPGCFVIEDAAQSILATRAGKRCDADITVFSGNVHKAVQCGEGGMCCTNDDDLAEAMRMGRNHGELAGHRGFRLIEHKPEFATVGLNLRLTEVQAAIWYVQLQKAEKIIAGRREIAEELSSFASDLELGKPPVVKPDCTHSYYVWALKCPNAYWVVKALVAEGMPVKRGCYTPLYKLPAFQQPIRRKVVEETEACLTVYENCTYDPTSLQMKQISEAFKKVADAQKL